MSWQVTLWRTGDQILSKTGDAFVLIDPDGSVARWFVPRSFSDEEDLWQTTYFVEGARLVKRTVVEHGSAEAVVHDETVEVSGLVAIDDAESKQRVKAALLAAHAAQARRDQELQRAAEARVAAIAGSLDDLGLGADASRAQRTLCERVRRWSDPLAAALLRTLVELAGARPDAAVIAAYVRGCLFACFSLEVPELAPGVPTTSRPELARAIEAHANEMDKDAEGQSSVDAHLNAAALWSGAKALRVAAALLS